MSVMGWIVTGIIVAVGCLIIVISSKKAKEAED